LIQGSKQLLQIVRWDRTSRFSCIL